MPKELIPQQRYTDLQKHKDANALFASFVHILELLTVHPPNL
jgi:hypothetical protein